MATGNYAVIEKGKNVVENIIVAGSEYSLENYYLVEIKDGVFCQAGMYYNSEDGLFYIDEQFSATSPVSVYDGN